MSRRRKIAAIIGVVLFVLGHVQVHVPLAGAVPVLTLLAWTAACAVAVFLVVVACGITRSLRAYTARAAW